MFRSDFTATAAIPMVATIPQTIDVIAASGIGPGGPLCTFGPASRQTHSRAI